MIKFHVNLDKLYSFDFLGLDNDDFENYSASASRLISDKARTATKVYKTPYVFQNIQNAGIGSCMIHISAQ